MGTIRSSLYLVALVACSGNKAKPDAPPPPIDAAPDAKPIDAPPDAPSHDLTCIGNTIGQVAATVTVSGTVTQLDVVNMQPSITMLAGATLNACKGNCQGANKLDTQTSDAQGAFTTKALTTGGTPLDGYISMTHTGDRTVQAYPPYPLTQNLDNVPILTFTPTALGLLSFVGCTQDAGKGMGAVIVTDCMNKRITDGGNVMLSLKQGGVEVTGTTVIDGGTLSPMGAGLFLICNVPPGLTTVNASYSGMTFLAHDVTYTAGTTTETQIRPGY